MQIPFKVIFMCPHCGEDIYVRKFDGFYVHEDRSLSFLDYNNDSDPMFQVDPVGFFKHMQEILTMLDSKCGYCKEAKRRLHIKVNEA